MRKNTILFLLMMFFITSCSLSPIALTPNVLEIGSTPTATETVTPRLTPTPITLPTATLDNRSSFQQSTSVLSDDFEQRCAVYTNQGFKLQGFLIVKMNMALPANQEKDISIIDLMNGTSTLFNSKEFSIPTVYNISPDRKWYFYLDSENIGAQLHIKAISGRENSVFYWDKQWGENINMSWLDNEHLSILKFSDKGQRMPFIIILSPFTGEWQTLEPNFPSGQNNDIPIVYVDQLLSRTIYVSGNSYVLWNAETGKDMWKKQGVNFSMLPRGWSPDGNIFAFIDTNTDTATINNEIYGVNRKGEEIQLTDLSNSFPLAKEIYILGMEWSPNSKYIAFSFLVKSKGKDFPNSPLLAVVDVENKKTTNLCIPVSQYAGEIVWSPFSDQVAVTTPMNSDVPGSDVVITDINQGSAFELIQNATTLGWMIAP